MYRTWSWNIQKVSHNIKIGLEKAEMRNRSPACSPYLETTKRVFTKHMSPDHDRVGRKEKIDLNFKLAVLRIKKQIVA